MSQAVKALQGAWPNGRDYHLQGPDALREAEVEWRSCMERLESMRKGLDELAFAISQAER